MKDRLARLPLRTRLVAGFVVAMLVLLVAAGAFVYWRVEYALDRGLDDELASASATIEPLVGPTGRVTNPEAADATGAVWQVLGPDGTVLDAGGAAGETPLVPASALDRVDGGSRTLELGTLLPVTSRPYRLQVTALEDGPAAYLLVGVRRDHRDEALRELLLQLTLAGLGALAVAAVVGDRLARAALRPVEEYRRRASEIAGGADGWRLDVPEGRDDEITRLGHTLNDMLAALDAALAHERRFVDDASHELRTPLTLLSSRLQLARRRHRTVEEHERILDELSVDVARLAELAEDLLELGSGADPDDGPVDVGPVVAGVVERHRLAHPEAATGLDVSLPVEPLSARIGVTALERVVANLLGNAALHGAPPVRLTVASRADRVVVEVSDAGPGMPPALLQSATGRFTRSDEARSRPGAGLGLSLVEQLVARSGGELRLCCGGEHTSYGVASGVPCEHGPAMTVTVLLPRASA
ncbi:sensor histidine kinase [Nocardioides taihuensis]|uniref:histidine kinase n=1 Tax=Nocardioides taihuensis TaxID=1835606 RepID=A0ABW0BJD7_9ACTN